MADEAGSPGPDEQRAQTKTLDLVKIAFALLVVLEIGFSQVSADTIGRMGWAAIAACLLPLLAVAGAALAPRLPPLAARALLPALPWASAIALLMLLASGNFDWSFWSALAALPAFAVLFSFSPSRPGPVRTFATGSDLSFALNAALATAATFSSLFNDKYWLLMVGNKVMAASWLTPALIVAIAVCFYAIASRSLTGRRWTTAGSVASGAVILITAFLVFPQEISTHYYHQHPLVEPALQVLQGGGVLMKSAFSQYGEGPVAVAILSNGLAGLELVESAALGWQIIWTLSFLLLAAIMLSGRTGPPVAKAIIVATIIAACGVAFFGRRYTDYPSVYVIRFATPVLAAFLLVVFGSGRRAFALAGLATGLAPYWNLEGSIFTAALIGWHAIYVLVARNAGWKEVGLRLACAGSAALLAFASATAAYYLYVGQLPRFSIHLEIIQGYAVTGIWLIQAMDPNASYLFVFPLAITAVYVMYFSARAVVQIAHGERQSSPASRELPDDDATAALHQLALLTAMGSVYFIGRPVYWTIASGLIFAGCALTVAAIRLSAELPRQSRPMQSAIIVLLAFFTAASAFTADIAYGPKGRAIIAKWEPVWTALAAGQPPRIHALSQLERWFEQPGASGFADAAKRYIAQGKSVELFSDDWRVTGPIRMRYHLTSQLPVSTWLSDSLSVTRRDELMTAARSLRPGTIILGPGPQHAADLRKLSVPIRSVSIDIIDNLVKERRIRELEASADTTVYVVNDKS